jgi:hypothetical protein
LIEIALLVVAACCRVFSLVGEQETQESICTDFELPKIVELSTRHRHDELRAQQEVSNAS